jgi:hypothetical protein
MYWVVGITKFPQTVKSKKVKTHAEELSSYRRMLDATNLKFLLWL